MPRPRAQSVVGLAPELGHGRVGDLLDVEDALGGFAPGPGHADGEDQPQSLALLRFFDFDVVHAGPLRS